MARLIVRSNYFKNEPARHKSNFVKYLGTREGVEFDPKQMPQMFWEDADMHGKKANYVDYLAERPGAVHVDGQVHGLFSDADRKVDLDQAMEEIANHPGTVWINVISLKREDAAKLGYDELEKWQALLRSHVSDMEEAFRIKSENLRWYAAFHNEGHHPHVHLVVFSKGGDGYLSKQGIEKLKSAYVRDIFKDELSFLYEAKTKQRKSVKEKAGEELLKAMEGLQGENYLDVMIEAKLRVLGQRLSGIKGKKVYGYLHKDVKAMVDDVFRDLEKNPEVKECYDKWLEWQEKITGYYQDKAAPKIPMSENPEFRSVKNAIIQEAIWINQEGGSAFHGSAGKGSEKENSSGNHGDGERTSPSDVPQAPSSALYASHQALKMFKYLEKIFQDKMKKSKLGRKMVAESKDLRREMERRAALGQKDGGSEDITQSL